MNILQITNYECASMSVNDNTGINRVVTALNTYYVNTYHDTCFNAYYNENSNGLSEIFAKGIKLTSPLNEDDFRSFITENLINVMVINVSNLEYVKQIPTLNKIAHECSVKSVYCFHFMPGYETRSYAAFSMVYYNLIHKIKPLDTFKKWLITISRPISSLQISKIIKERYAQPLETSNKVVVFSPNYIQQYLDIAHSIDRDKFEVIHNPLPFLTYINQEELVNKKKEVIIVGRLYEPTKRVSYALRVWKMIEKDSNLNDWKLTIVGEGISDGYYKWLAKKYKLKNVQFVGRQDPKPYYRKASILLSISSHESWPMVIMESMPMGVVPCVFNSYSATSEIIDHNVNGMIAPDNDLQAFYTSLKDLMRNDQKRIQMAEAAINKAKSSDMNIIGKQWRTLLNDLDNI